MKKSFSDLVAIVKRLRDPNGGCPWDIEQTHESLKPYIIEEAYEVIEAIDAKSPDLPGELGDLLLQVLMHSQVASDDKRFTIDDVIEKICHKLITRHPHVFGEVNVEGSKEVLKNWERIKQKELSPGKSIVDGVPRGMPALLRGQRIGEKAARVGFEWPTVEGVRDKVLEEVREFAEACLDLEDKEKLSDEFGDILFSLTQLARRLDINSEDLLHKAIDKFSRRFKAMESEAPKALHELTIDELDGIWERVKAREPGRVPRSD